MHGRGNSYPPHVRRINDAFPGLRPLRFRRLPLVRQRQQYDCCQLIFKLPVLWRSGAAARLSSLHTPVETGAAPGGAEGSRTPVRKHFDRTFSGRSQVSAFPPCKDTGQTLQFSRVMMHGRGNSYPPHGRHLNDAFPSRWPLWFRRSLLKQRRQQC